ncbi:MAG: hypothetical protein K1X89_15065 [Myxococcaceae bacterium]|nr:hypothetical protein [Myxococcaceae bacterium]
MKVKAKPTTAPRPATTAAPKRATHRPARDAAQADAPPGLTAAPKPVSTALTGAAHAPKRVGPEQAGKVGDLVAAPPLTATVGDVLSAKRALDAKVAANPNALAQLRAKPFPRGAEARLEWALARPAGVPNLQNPLWTVATNDARAATVAFAQGMLAASAAGLPMTDALETQVANANQALMMDFTQLTALQQQPFPANGTLEQQLSWAVAITYAWDWTSNPAVTADPKALALTSFVNGALAKAGNNGPPETLASERRTLKVGDDTRVFAIHTPPGKPPKDGWPTVLFFHGSFGGHAPEQNAEYQQLNALADAHGFQVLYPVGLPQDRADARTGRGMLNWDPVGAGPGGANDRFVHELLQKFTHATGHEKADRSKVFAAGHSQGGFYTSDLVAAYPGVFAGAAIFGAGMGAVAQGVDLSSEQRKTPTLLRVGLDDIHISVGEQLAGRFEAGGFGQALRFDRLPDRGHEVLGEDLEAMLGFFEQQPAFAASKAGTLDGTQGEGAPRPPVFGGALDLRALPATLLAQPNLARAVAALAQNPFLQADPDQQTFSAQEWQLARYYEATFPPAMQQAIEALRPYFVTGAPPKGKVIDLARIPPELQTSAEAMAALRTLLSTPALDLDGYPGLLTAEEIAASVDFKSTFPPQVQAGIDVLRTYFFGVAQAQGPDLRPRAAEVLPGGAKLESYPGSDVAVGKMKTLVAGLSRDPAFAALLARTTLVIAPPGRNIDAIPEGVGYGAGVEGVAGSDGFDGGGHHIPAPAFLVREDSIRQWNLGAAHELLHLLRFSKGDAVGAELASVWQQIGGRDGQPDGYPNAEEMFAYFGQWYLAGFGEQLRQVSPEAYAFCQRNIGNARVDPLGLTANDALPALQSLLGWFRSGQHART